MRFTSGWRTSNGLSLTSPDLFRIAKVAKSPDHSRSGHEAPQPAPSAARLTKPAAGLAVDLSTELNASDEATQLAVQEQLQRVPGRKLPRSARPVRATGPELPVACAGGACWTRDQFKRIAERCKRDKACIQLEIKKAKDAARQAGGSVPGMS